MAKKNSNTTFQKRQREIARQDKRRQKVERRETRKREKEESPAETSEGPIEDEADAGDGKPGDW